jgi:hypothetical protein
MNIRHLLTCTAVAVSALGASQAHASTPVSVVVSAPAATFSTPVATDAALGSYTTGVFSIGSSATGFLVYVNASSSSSLDDFSLFSVLGSGATLLQPNADYDFDGSTLVYNYSNLTSGDYKVVATGALGSKAEVSYSISSVASVPEAGSIALALAGLGVVALMLRRKAH